MVGEWLQDRPEKMLGEKNGSRTSVGFFLFLFLKRLLTLSPFLMADLPSVWLKTIIGRHALQHMSGKGSLSFINTGGQTKPPVCSRYY
jgi:hypothetical protein